MSAHRLAVISDVHGNRWALEAVLEDIGRRGVRDVVNLGDCLYGPLDPAGTADLLMALDLPTVRGNEDRLLVEEGGEGDEPDAHAASSPSLAHTLACLSPAHLAWLRGLPPLLTAHGGELLLCHGSPGRDDAYLLWDVTPDGARPRPPAAIAAALAGAAAVTNASVAGAARTAGVNPGAAVVPVVLCGHDHLPRSVRLPAGTLVVDPGSVGLPAYFDDTPPPHAMQTGSTHARYALVTRDRDGWSAQDIPVAYDWEAAATAAARHGRPDWARWLREGIAAP
jgi:predicted phosphodiesterase